MTRMAGANPKIAAIFGGGDFGMDYDKMNQQAYMSQIRFTECCNNGLTPKLMAENKKLITLKNLESIKANAIGAQSSAGQGLCGA